MFDCILTPATSFPLIVFLSKFPCLLRANLHLNYTGNEGPHLSIWILIHLFVKNLQYYLHEGIR